MCLYMVAGGSEGGGAVDAAAAMEAKLAMASQKSAGNRCGYVQMGPCWCRMRPICVDICVRYVWIHVTLRVDMCK